MAANELPPAPTVATGRFQFAALFVGLCLAVLTQALDNTILATAIPKITDEFNSLADVGWYGAGYLLTTCSFQLFYGKLYNLYPIKWIFLGALGLFELGSLICGAAPNSIALIMGRVVAGIGTGGIFSGATLIIAELKPLQERPLYNGVLGSMFAIASVGGPLLGGLFADTVTWRLCFYVNLPLGLVTAVIVFLVVPNTYNAERQSRRLLTFKQKLSEMDLPGLLVLVPAIICVLLAVQWGGRYPWNSGRVIALFVIGGLLAVLFVVLQIRQGDRAIVPPSVIRRRTVWACAFFSFNLFGSFLALSYYLPIWFQAIKRDTATQSGIHNLPSILATTVLSVVAGGLVFGVGYYTWACLLGSILAAIGSGLLTTFENDTSARNWIGYQILYGAGIGFGLNQPLIAVQTALPVQQIAEGTSLIGFTQIFGGTIIITIAQNVFTNRLVANVRAQGIPVDPQRLLAIGATQLQSLVEPQYLERLQFAYNETITQTFYVVVATASLSLFGSALIPWFSVKKKPQDFADPDTEMSSPVSTQDRKLS